MHNLSNRANLVFAFLVSAVFAVLAIVAISSPLLLSQVQLGPVVIKTPRVQV